jgi:DNA-binding response OmpR family regulator
MAYRGTIVMIDDDKHSNQHYVDCLRHSGFEVVLCLKADDVMPTIRSLERTVVLIILDIMMPRGHYSAVETQDGLCTGAMIYHDIRKEYPVTPILSLTIVGNVAASDLSDNDPNLVVISKLECGLEELHVQVEQLLSHRSEP